MKNNKVLIIVGVLLLNVLVGFTIGQVLLGKESQYDKKLGEARALAQQELCSKSITKYNEVLASKDTLDVRLEMLGVYEKGIDIGEFSQAYDIFAAVTDMVNDYRDQPVAYEEACEMFLKYYKYEECANILMQARDLSVTSEKIEEYREQVRYQHMKYFSMYTEVNPMFDGMYMVKSGENYLFINEDASPKVEGAFVEASSFSEGYAFVKTQRADGEQKAFLINKSGERQVYFNDVESSSGVGRAKDAEGKALLLLACKSGDVYSYYDINGNKVFGEYAFAGRFRNNVAAVQEKDGQWKLIDGTGKPVTEQTFSDVILNEFDECAPKGLIFAKSDEAYHLFDLKGTKIGNLSCDGAKAFVGDYAAVKQGEQWGFADSKGEIVIEPQYEDAKSFSNQMGAVKTGGGWAFINPKNEIVVQETFEEVDYLNDKGICFVKADGYWSYLKMYYYGG